MHSQGQTLKKIPSPTKIIIYRNLSSSMIKRDIDMVLLTTRLNDPKQNGNMIVQSINSVDQLLEMIAVTTIGIGNFTSIIDIQASA